MLIFLYLQKGCGSQVADGKVYVVGFSSQSREIVSRFREPVSVFSHRLLWLQI